MIFLLLISVLSFSVISFSAFSFELPTSMLTQHADKTYVLSRSLSDTQLRARILAQYQKWQGTRYRWGGTTRRGVDCSALMQHLFSDAAHLTLPRTTGEQILRGVRVDQYRLQAGDLLFFQTGPHRRHVGVYIGDNEFIHASTSQGVTVSTLASDYWQSRYITARRVAWSPA